MDRQVLAYQSDIVIVDKDQKTVGMIDVAVTTTSGKREYENVEKYHGLILLRDNSR